jgi:hypothetical protein
MKLVNSTSARCMFPPHLTQPYTRAVKPIAVDEGEFLRWNADPFTLDGGSGTSEADPGDGADLVFGARCTSFPHTTMSFCRGRLLYLGLLDGEVCCAQ